MGPTKTVRSKHVSKGPNKPSASGKIRSVRTSASKSRVSKKLKLPPPKQQKTRSTQTSAKRKKQKTYTDEELGIPKLNMITPVGVEAPKGKKKGKIFVDDGESMMTIFAIVNADKEGQIESKMMKARQMEEIREARRKEAEKREEARKGKLEETKKAMRKKRNKNGNVSSIESRTGEQEKVVKSGKSVSFA